MENDRLTASIIENRCYVCGTEGGKQIKVGDTLYIVLLGTKHLVPICNICNTHYPIDLENLDLVHVVWTILDKRLNQCIVYTKVCLHCQAPITTARKEKKFCSNNCKSKHWYAKNTTQRDNIKGEKNEELEKRND